MIITMAAGIHGVSILLIIGVSPPGALGLGEAHGTGTVGLGDGTHGTGISDSMIHGSAHGLSDLGITHGITHGTVRGMTLGMAQYIRGDHTVAVTSYGMAAADTGDSIILGMSSAMAVVQGVSPVPDMHPEPLPAMCHVRDPQWPESGLRLQPEAVQVCHLAAWRL